MWLKILLVVTVILFIVVLVVKRFAYFRPSFTFKPPKENFQDLYEGNLHAWFREGKGNTVILFCHGNGGNLTDRQDKLLELLKTGHSVLIFDYSGYGHSKGVPNEQLCYNNACRFVDMLRQQGYTTIIPYGESMGGAVAAYIARKYNTPKLIIESGLPSIKDVIKSRSKFLGILLGCIFNEFNTVKYLDGYKGESLVLHSKDDEVIHYHSTKKMRELATNTVDMSGTHNHPDIPWETVRQFIGVFSQEK